MLQARRLQKACATDLTTSSFAAIPPTIATPSGNGIVNLLGGEHGSPIPKRMLVMPYGVGGANNDAFDLKLTGWRLVGTPGHQDTTKALWIPQHLVTVSCTLSSTVKGVAGAFLDDTSYFADTIVPKTAHVTEPRMTSDDFAGAGFFADSLIVMSQADDTAGWFIIQLYCVDMIQFQGDQTTNTPAMNALFAMLDDGR